MSAQTLRLRRLQVRDNVFCQHVLSVTGPNWVAELEAAERASELEFLASIPPFPPMTEAELDAMAELYDGDGADGE